MFKNSKFIQSLLSSFSSFFKKLKEDKKFRNFFIIIISILFIIVVINSVYRFSIYKFDKKDDFSLKYADFFNIPAFVINGDKMLYNDFISDFKTLSYYYQKRNSENPDMPIIPDNDIKKELKEKTIQDYFMFQLASDYNINVSSVEIENEFNEVIDQLGDASKIEQAIFDAYSWSIDEFKENVLKPFILREKLENYISLNDQINKDKKDLISSILSEIQNSNKDFSYFAKKYSEDVGSSENGGDLGWILRGQMIEEFEDVVFSLEEDEISDIFKTKYGYHIAKVSSRASIGEPEESVRVSHILIRTKGLDDLINEKINDSIIKTKIKIY
ncbi:peptidylprolyl isomerase [Patescibacteria group bacterium]|nr:peptidylprolyl isomerase [Patescibacteria group bacterium]